MQVESSAGPPGLPHRPVTVTRIEASKGILLPDLREVWHFKELLYYMLWRDVKARYKQTLVGSLWAIIRPVVTMIQMTLIFNYVAKIDSGDVPYPLFSFVGISIWGYFSSCVTSGSSSLLGAGGIVSKTYFPRLFVPIASVTAPLIDFALTLPILGLLMVRYHWAPGWQIVLMPLFLLFALLAGLAVALWLAPVTVRYRDIPFALPFLVQIWFYATPIVYPAEKFRESVPEKWHWIVDYNPMTAVVEGFRWSVLGGDTPSFGLLLPSTVVMFLLLLGGLLSFRRAERTVVDVL